ncbi:MAG: hypothetical protein U5N56_05565 [Candidatus Marinimicrobia bacterium]|nr:hypothetical protein [Candidatus Neomarinimicrobiota bacterium]
MSQKYFILLLLLFYSPLNFLSAQIIPVKIDTLISDHKVNEDKGRCGHYAPFIAMTGNGSYVITWVDYRNGNSDIYAQRFDKAGKPLGESILINDDMLYLQYLSLAITDNGSCFIVWASNRDGTFDIFLNNWIPLAM